MKRSLFSREILNRTQLNDGSCYFSCNIGESTEDIAACPWGLLFLSREGGTKFPKFLLSTIGIYFYRFQVWRTDKDLVALVDNFEDRVINSYSWQRGGLKTDFIYQLLEHGYIAPSNPTNFSNKPEIFDTQLH